MQIKKVKFYNSKKNSHFLFHVFFIFKIFKQNIFQFHFFFQFNIPEHAQYIFVSPRAKRFRTPGIKKSHLSSSIDCKMAPSVYRLFQTPGLSPGSYEVVFSKLKNLVSDQELQNFTTELCFYVNAEHELTVEEKDQLWRLFSKPFQSCKTTENSQIIPVKPSTEASSSITIEIGPRLNFSTAFSTNAVSICKSVGLTKIDRIEQSRRYVFEVQPKDGFSKPFTKEDEQKLVDALHDRMTECRYLKPIESFVIDIKPEDCYDVDILGQGRTALEKVNSDLGLAFDDWDLDYYSNLFKERIGRNPTNVECFDLAQSNSEHSRHWFFRGTLVVDGNEVDNSLMKMVMKTQDTSNDNNVIKFSDNSR